MHVGIAFEWVIAGAFTALRSSHISGCHFKHGGVIFGKKSIHKRYPFIDNN